MPCCLWSSSDEAVAVIGLDGRITGIGLGTATISVETEDRQFSATCEITVVDALPEEEKGGKGISGSVGIVWSGGWTAGFPGHWPVPKGSNASDFGVNLDVVKLDANGNITGSDISDDVTWHSSNTAVATVDQWGRVLGLAEGTAVISMLAKPGYSITVKIRCILQFILHTQQHIPGLHWIGLASIRAHSQIATATAWWARFQQQHF